jgi:hypothetical protein
MSRSKILPRRLQQCLRRYSCHSYHVSRTWYRDIQHVSMNYYCKREEKKRMFHQIEHNTRINRYNAVKTRTRRRTIHVARSGNGAVSAAQRFPLYFYANNYAFRKTGRRGRPRGHGGRWSQNRPASESQTARTTRRTAPCRSNLFVISVPHVARVT